MQLHLPQEEDIQVEEPPGSITLMLITLRSILLAIKAALFVKEWWRMGEGRVLEVG